MSDLDYQNLGTCSCVYFVGTVYKFGLKLDRWGVSMFVRIYTGNDGQSHMEEMAALTASVPRIPTKPGEDLVFRRFE